MNKLRLGRHEPYGVVITDDWYADTALAFL
jgi:hypothetical protein